MAVPSAQVAAQRWVQGLSGATAKIQQGIEAVTQAPGAKAAAQQALYLSQIQANAAKWARNTAAVSLQSWKDAAISKGIPRIALGAQQAQPKMEAVMTKLLPFISNAKSSLDAQNPRGNLQQNIQRMVAWANTMATFEK